MDDATRFAGAGIPESRGAEWIHYHITPRNADLSHLEAGTHPAAGVSVFVNHGRWVAECPDCKNAQLACRTDHRFLCNNCGNVTIQGLWRSVLWPADIAGIEAALASRPIVNQNWETGQTVEDLKAETRVHKEFR